MGIQPPSPEVWRYSLPEPERFQSFSGLKPIAEFVPEVQLRPEIRHFCGWLPQKEQEPGLNFVNLELRGSTERWVPIDGETHKTFHFEIAR